MTRYADLSDSPSVLTKVFTMLAADLGSHCPRFRANFLVSSDQRQLSENADWSSCPDCRVAVTTVSYERPELNGGSRYASETEPAESCEIASRLSIAHKRLMGSLTQQHPNATPPTRKERCRGLKILAYCVSDDPSARNSVSLGDAFDLTMLLLG